MELLDYLRGAPLIIEQFSGIREVLLYFIIGGIFVAAVYALRTVGLYVIARREGIKNRWMVFIPFVSTYYIAVCGQKNRFLNIDTRIVGLVAAVLEFLLAGLYVFSIVVSFTVDPYIMYTTGEILPGIESTTTTLNEIDLLAQSPSLGWAVWCYYFMDLYIISWLNLIYMLVMVVLLNCFFQTYSTRRYFLFTVTSVLFPVQGILIFAVRNNKGVNYAEYMRSVQERMYRQYRQQNFEQNPYNQNPYDRNVPHTDAPYGNTDPSPKGKQDEPFSEFGGTGNSDPFDEFKN